MSSKFTVIVQVQRVTTMKASFFLELSNVEAPKTEGELKGIKEAGECPAATVYTENTLH